MFQSQSNKFDIKQVNAELVQEIFQLFQISLSIGKSLNPSENVASFLQTVMSIKGLSYGGLWVNTQLLFEETQIDFQESYKLIKSFPNFIVTHKVVTSKNSDFYIKLRNNPYVILNFNEENRTFFEQRKQTKGQLALIHLPQVGWLEFHSNQDNLTEVTVKKLLPVFHKFAKTITASLANERTIKTQELLRKSENEKRKTQEELIKQLRKNEQLQLKLNLELEQKVEERTQEIMTQNEELVQQQEEILAQRDFIEQQNINLKQINENMTASIRYALTIQKSILPNSQQLTKNLTDHFVFYRPKDIVSGDYYWVQQVGNAKLVAVVDCTGHGVPGAFMSLISYAMLSEEVLKRGRTEVTEILDVMDELVRTTLHQKEMGIQDGMDIALCKITPVNDKESIIEFAGARRPMYYINDLVSEIQEIKGTRKSIGGYIGKSKKRFAKTTLLLPKGTLVYLTTDGFADQHNNSNKKIGSKQLKSLFNKLHKYNMAQHHDILDNILELHQQDQIQRDDITILGFKI